MEKIITKSRFSISVSPEVYKELEHINNKSKYIEELIYNYLLEKNVEGVEDIII